MPTMIELPRKNLTLNCVEEIYKIIIINCDT